MKLPTTIDGYLDHVDKFVAEGRQINLSDLTQSEKVARLTTLQVDYGFRLPA